MAIVVYCSRPGRKRAGIEHPSRAVYPPGALTTEQLKEIVSDAEFLVVEGEILTPDHFRDNPRASEPMGGEASEGKDVSPKIAARGRQAKGKAG